MDEHASVSEIMTRIVAQTAPTASAHEAAVLMRTNHVSGLPVVDPAGRLVGVVSEIDLVRGVHRGTGAMSARGFLDILLESSARSGPGLLESSQSRLKNARVSEFMTSGVVTVDPVTTIREASRLLALHGISRLPVVDEDRHVLGIVTRTDIFTAVGGKTLGPKGSLTPAPKGKASRGRAGVKSDPYADV